MGADIHVFLEKKTTINKESKWVNIDYWQKNPHYDGVDEYEREYEHVPVYTGRNYELFNILAGVRGSGDGMIEEPRGLPGNVSETTKEESDRWSSDGHSYSYFTLFELKEFLEKNPSDEPSPLIHIIKKIDERFKGEFYIYDDERHPEKEVSMRIVFWFDN